jgi:hypothetical protein
MVMTRIILKCNDIEVIMLNTENIPRIDETISIKEKKETTKYKVKNIDYSYKTSGFSDGYYNDTIIMEVEKIIKNKPIEHYKFSPRHSF